MNEMGAVRPPVKWRAVMATSSAEHDRDEWYFHLPRLRISLSLNSHVRSSHKVDSIYVNCRYGVKARKLYTETARNADTLTARGDLDGSLVRFARGEIFMGNVQGCRRQLLPVPNYLYILRCIFRTRTCQSKRKRRSWDSHQLYLSSADGKCVRLSTHVSTSLVCDTLDHMRTSIKCQHGYFHRQGRQIKQIVIIRLVHPVCMRPAGGAIKTLKRATIKLCGKRRRQ